MNQKFIQQVIKVTCIAGAMASGLVFSSIPVGAAGFHKGVNNNGIVISSKKFNDLLDKTNIDHLGYHFGAPDEIQALKDTFGERVGSVWVYHNAVQKDDSKQDAHFVIIDGKLQYTTLSDAM